MKTASIPLIALLATGSFCTWDLYTVTLPGGQIVRLCSAPFDVIDNIGNSYNSGALGSGFPKVDSQSGRAVKSVKAGLDPDNWTVYFIPQVTDVFNGVLTYPDVIGSIPWLTACNNGVFDGASVIVKRAYFSIPPLYPLSVASRTCVGATFEFAGYLGTLDVRGTVSIFSFIGWSSLLSQTMPRNLYQPGCRHALFDARCSLNPAAFVKAGFALAGSTKAAMNSAVGAPSGSGTYALGSLTFTSGLNSGLTRLISFWDGAQAFKFLVPFPYAISIGDAFNAYPGCDKSLGAKGCGGFNNKINNGSTPYVPLVDIMLG